MIDTTTAASVNHSSQRQPFVAAWGFAVPLALLALGVASGLLYFWGRDLHRFTQWVAAYIGLFIGQLGLYLAACYVVLRWGSGTSRNAKIATLVLMLLFAAGFRGVLSQQRPYLSSDVYRYIWDGHIQSSGINPYSHVPEADELRDLRDDKIYPNIPNEDRDWLSPYPPVAQIIFYAVSKTWPMSVAAFKTAMSLFDLITTLLLVLVLARSRMDPARALIFAWHPLVIFEGAHSGHIEAVFITFLTLALFAWTERRHTLTGVALGLATLVKFYPILLLPVFLIGRNDNAADEPLYEAAEATDPPRRDRLPVSALLDKRSLLTLSGFVLTIALAYLPYLGAGGKLFGFLRGYVEEEGFAQSGARYFLLMAARQLIAVPTMIFIVIVICAFVLIALNWLLKEKRGAADAARGAIAIIGFYLLVTTPRYSWYYIWLIPFLCLVPRIGWLYLTCASALLYLSWYTPLVYPDIPIWLGASIYGPTIGLLIWGRLKSRWTASTG